MNCDRHTLERILRAYEAADISTRRCMELIDQLYSGRDNWHPTRIWENI